MAAFAFAFVHACECQAVFAFHESLIERENGIGNVLDEGFSFLGDFGALCLHALPSLLDGCQILVDQSLGMGKAGFGLLEQGPEAIDFLHHFQLAGFQAVEFLFIADDFVGDRLIFVVFTGFELLGFEASDGGFAGSGVEFEILEFDLLLVDRCFCVGNRLLVPSEFGFRPGLILGEFFEVFGERQQAAVTVLED